MLYKCLLLLAHFAKITDLVFKQTLGKWEDLSLFALWPNCLQKKTNHGSRNKRVRTELKSNCHNSTTTSNKFCCPQWVDEGQDSMLVSTCSCLSTLTRQSPSPSQGQGGPCLLDDLLLRSSAQTTAWLSCSQGTDFFQTNIPVLYFLTEACTES